MAETAKKLIFWHGKLWVRTPIPPRDNWVITSLFDTEKIDAKRNFQEQIKNIKRLKQTQTDKPAESCRRLQRSRGQKRGSTVVPPSSSVASPPWPDEKSLRSRQRVRDWKRKKFQIKILSVICTRRRHKVEVTRPHTKLFSKFWLGQSKMHTGTKTSVWVGLRVNSKFVGNFVAHLKISKTKRS